LAQTEVFFFRDPKGDSVPLLKWLDDLPVKVKVKCVERIDRLGELGHEIRRPEADFLRDGIYELRASFRGVHSGCFTSLRERLWWWYLMVSRRRGKSHPEKSILR
jgi:Phage derived protein Gp49-like (DUF891)